MGNPSGKCNKEDLVQWIIFALKKALTKPNIMVGFKECEISPFNPNAINDKMKHSKPYKPMEVEVQEFVKDI